MSKRAAGARAGLLVAAVAAIAIVAGSCSSKDDVHVGVNGTLAPYTTGGSCVDPKGDISGDPTKSGTRTEPSGIDLLKVDAKVTDTALDVTYQTAGPIAPTKSPTFILSQGPAAQTVSFEIRAEGGADPTKPWPLTLVSWKVTPGGNRESRGSLAETATVDGSTLHYSIPLKELPPIATLIWQFGAQSGGDAGFLDDCSSFDDSSTTLPPEPDPGTSSATTTTIPDVKLGEPQMHKGGEKVTVFEVQDPPVKQKKLPAPLDADRRVVSIKVEFCASPDRPGLARARQFGVTLASNEIYPAWAEVQEIDDDTEYPSFPLNQELQPGKCIRNWVSFKLPKDVAIVDVFYSENPSGDDAVVWKLAGAATGTSTTTAPTATTATTAK